MEDQESSKAGVAQLMSQSVIASLRRRLQLGSAAMPHPKPKPKKSSPDQRSWVPKRQEKAPASHLLLSYHPSSYKRLENTIRINYITNQLNM